VNLQLLESAGVAFRVRVSFFSASTAARALSDIFHHQANCFVVVGLRRAPCLVQLRVAQSLQQLSFVNRIRFAIKARLQRLTSSVAARRLLGSPPHPQ